jgi:hypothetical protein
LVLATVMPEPSVKAVPPEAVTAPFTVTLELAANDSAPAAEKTNDEIDGLQVSEPPMVRSPEVVTEGVALEPIVETQV